MIFCLVDLAILVLLSASQNVRLSGTQGHPVMVPKLFSWFYAFQVGLHVLYLRVGMLNVISVQSVLYWISEDSSCIGPGPRNNSPIIKYVGNLLSDDQIMISTLYWLTCICSDYWMFQLSRIRFQFTIQNTSKYCSVTSHCWNLNR